MGDAYWHPVNLIWDAAGWPDPDWQGRSKTPTRPPSARMGVCALTGQHGPVFPASQVVSANFTSWDRLPWAGTDPAGPAFGPAAAWALRHRAAKTRLHVASPADGLAEVGPAGLAETLARPLGPATAALVPISRQKHLLPWAEMGRVRTDDDTLPWGHREVDLLAAVARLRQLGFTEPALGEPCPRWGVLSRLRGDDCVWVLDTWPRLDRWRERPAYMEVARRATRKEKT